MTVSQARLRAAADAIMGKPYEEGACGPDRFYCVGVLIHLIWELLGVRLEDPQGHGIDAILAFWRRFKRVAEPRPLDALYFPQGDSPRPHVAVVEDGRYGIQAASLQGVHRAELWELRSQPHRIYRFREVTAWCA